MELLTQQDNFTQLESIGLLPVHVEGIRLYYNGVLLHKDVSEDLDIKGLRARKIVTEVKEKHNRLSPEMAMYANTRLKLLYMFIHQGLLPSFFGQLPEDYPLQSTDRHITEKEKDALLSFGLGLNKAEVSQLLDTPADTIRSQMTNIRTKFQSTEQNPKAQIYRGRMPYSLMSMWFMRSGQLVDDPYMPINNEPPFFMLNAYDQKALYFGEYGIRARCIGNISPKDPMLCESPNTSYLEP